MDFIIIIAIMILHIRENNNNTCIEEVWEEFPSFNQYEIRSALAKCGLTSKQIESKIRVLSGTSSF